MLENNFIILACLIILAVFYTGNSSLDRYEQDMQLALMKTQNLINSRITVLKPAKGFYQAAMEERIPLALRRQSTVSSSIHIKVGEGILPSYFKDYIDL